MHITPSSVLVDWNRRSIGMVQIVVPVLEPVFATEQLMADDLRDSL